MKKDLSLLLLAVLCVASTVTAADPDETQTDADTLPTAPAEFEVTLFAREPLTRQPCSMAFDARGRLFVGMGPQYRNPTPETPGDSVVLLLDTNGDGRADRSQVFATGFNAVQGLAWHGRELWVANAPDLTLVRDLDGDDQADEYVRVYTDLGNLEHGLHGLTWAPDGRLYMSKGNSKGLTQPGRIAPKPFRDLWGVTAPPGTPDFPAPQVFRKEDYRHAYHDPADDWGMDGGILRCDDGGGNLEIVCRGFRNPWDIAFDDGFNWLGTDNDQTTGDRVFMPFDGAHFGWNHPWSSHWSTAPHPPTAPVSGPLFEGSGTGVVFGDSPQFPPAYRRVFFINDWLRKSTFVWRPEWEGGLMRPHGGEWEEFLAGGNSLFRPTDLEFGPDGALWVLGWGSGYGAEWKEGELSNEGRIFRITWNDAPPGKDHTGSDHRPLTARSVADLIGDFSGPLAVRRIDARDEIVRRGREVRKELRDALRSGQLTAMQQTWVAWALGGIAYEDTMIDQFFAQLVHDDSAEPAPLNLRIQSIRILGERSHSGSSCSDLHKALKTGLADDEPRLRLAAVQALLRAGSEHAILYQELCQLLERETDATVFYAGWQTLRRLLSEADLRSLLHDSRPAVQRAALLGLLETHALSRQEVTAVLAKQPAPEVREIAELWLAKAGDGMDQRVIRGRPIDAAPTSPVPHDRHQIAVVGRLTTRSRNSYRIQPQGLRPGVAAYTDRPYRFRSVPEELLGLDLIQTANNDDGSSGTGWLSVEAFLPVRVFVGIDLRQIPPQWLRDSFRRTQHVASIDEGAQFQLYVREFPAGPIRLGGNTDDGKTGGKGNYILAFQPQALKQQKSAVTLQQVLPLIGNADKTRGEVLFHHAGGAGCFKCHSLDSTRNAFGPDLSSVGLRSSDRHLAQSLIDPGAVITEGFTMQTVLTDAGKVYSGVLLEESGLSVSLGTNQGMRLDIPRSQIEERRSSRQSAMPSMARLLTPQQVADVAAYLATQKAAVSKPGPDPVAEFSVESKSDRLIISLAGQAVAEFIFSDRKVLRPCFAQVRTRSGRRVTRTHPPIAEIDATDHDTMHPGIWLAFGDISGHDFWRNKGRIEHVRFTKPPSATGNTLTFATESRLLTPAGSELCRMNSQFQLQTRPAGWLLDWDATFQSDTGEFTFGDQEEMGFGARVATPLTEKAGGEITSSNGRRTAADTWGTAAKWCDYSGKPSERSAGITLIPHTGNFRESWWHNRAYGVFVANPFGRKAMKQGESSSIAVPQGRPFRIRFSAVIHEGPDYDPAQEFKSLQEQHSAETDGRQKPQAVE